MYNIQVHKGINQINSLFYRLGLWSRGDEATIREWRLQLFYSFYVILFPISLLSGAFLSEDRDEIVFLVETAIMVSVVLFKLLHIIWKKKQILELLNRVGVYSIEDHTQFTVVNDKLKSLMKLITVIITFVYSIDVCAMLVVPFLGSEKQLFCNIGFPMDYKNSDIAFWIAFTFFITQAVLYMVAYLYSILMWYLLINCASRYDVLGHQIQNMGLIRSVDEKDDKGKFSLLEKQNIFHCDLLAAIEAHKYVKELINQLDSFFSNIFLIQLATSALCICCSVYCLVFSDTEKIIERLIHVGFLLYNVFDIFMLMYHGNEIKLTSDRLSYCLFESDWVDQPQSTKKTMIIFGELLRQPHKLVILTLYPLTLETFRRILSAAYDMFNILKNLK